MSLEIPFPFDQTRPPGASSGPDTLENRVWWSLNVLRLPVSGALLVPVRDLVSCHTVCVVSEAQRGPNS